MPKNTRVMPTIVGDTIQQRQGDDFVYLPVLYVNGVLTTVSGEKPVATAGRATLRANIAAELLKKQFAKALKAGRAISYADPKAAKKAKKPRGQFWTTEPPKAWGWYWVLTKIGSGLPDQRVAWFYSWDKDQKVPDRIVSAAGDRPLPEATRTFIRFSGRPIPEPTGAY